MSQPLYPRPKRVSAAAYTFLFIGGIGVIRSILTGFWPRLNSGEEPTPSVIHIVDFTLSAALVLCACFMIRGANWARIVCYIPMALLVWGYFAMGMVPWAVALILASILLSTPPSHRFFVGRNPKLSRMAEGEDEGSAPKLDGPESSSQSSSRYDY